MTDENPTLKDIWRLVGSMNKRFGERFDNLERQFVLLREDFANLRGEFAELKVYVNTGFGALKQSIEARDFRLDEHGRRISALEEQQR
jgi:hypothetical protein